MNEQGMPASRVVPEWLGYILLVFSFAVVGCKRNDSSPAKPVTAEEIIKQNINLPVGQSIQPIAGRLVAESVFVSTESAPSTQPTTVRLDKLRFRTAKDNQGRTWAYAYTSEEMLLKAFTQGSPYVKLSFVDFFGIIDRDSEFAGIFLNSGSDASYPIPRELFKDVKLVLRPQGQ